VTRLALLLGFAATFLACAPSLAADTQPAAPVRILGAGSGDSECHGWIVAAIPGEGTRAELLHLPPRSTFSGPDGPRAGAPAGSARLVRWLSSMPDAIAAAGDTVFMVFPRGTSPGARTVLSLRATRSPRGEWGSGDASRLDALPVLREPGTLDGLVADPEGLWALLAQSSLAGRHVSLHVLSEGAWRTRDLPEPLRGPDADASSLFLTRLDGRAAIVRFARGGPAAWVWTPPADGHSQGAWREHVLAPLRAGGDVIACAGVDGSIVYALPADDADLELRLLTDVLDWRLARPQGSRQPLALIPLDAVGRVVVAWGTRDRGAGGRSPERVSYRLAEVSAWTGSVVYLGPARAVASVGVGEWRALAAGLIAFLLAILLFVLRPGAAGKPDLPAGTRLAEPSRRLVAAAFDLALSCIIAARVLDLPLGSILLPVDMSAPVSGFGPALLALGISGLHATLGEAIAGRSLGKWITGCRVIAVGAPAPARSGIGLRRALLRNVVRWGLPPLAMLGAADASRRHHGDLLARTAVVVDAPAEPDANPG
jgi:hypothetical protein